MHKTYTDTETRGDFLQSGTSPSYCAMLGVLGGDHKRRQHPSPKLATVPVSTPCTRDTLYILQFQVDAINICSISFLINSASFPHSLPIPSAQTSSLLFQYSEEGAALSSIRAGKRKNYKSLRLQLATQRRVCQLCSHHGHD